MLSVTRFVALSVTCFMSLRMCRLWRRALSIWAELGVSAYVSWLRRNISSRAVLGCSGMAFCLKHLCCLLHGSVFCNSAFPCCGEQEERDECKVTEHTHHKNRSAEVAPDVPKQRLARACEFRHFTGGHLIACSHWFHLERSERGHIFAGSLHPLAPVQHGVPEVEVSLRDDAPNCGSRNIHAVLAPEETCNFIFAHEGGLHSVDPNKIHQRLRDLRLAQHMRPVRALLKRAKVLWVQPL